MPPILQVLLIGTLTAGTAAVGAVPVALAGAPLPGRWLGWAHAAAAGLMLGAGYLLAAAVHDWPAVPQAAGAVVGIGALHGLRRWAGAAATGVEGTGPATKPQPVRAYALHATAEGLAIGSALAVDFAFGVFVAVALAIHNLPEAAALAAALLGRDAPLSHTVLWSVAGNAGQPIGALVFFAVAVRLPTLLAGQVGFAVGALLYLVAAELLPEAYEEEGSTSIAVIVALALSAVVLMENVVH
jgi:ZIP family zinc transporter